MSSLPSPPASPTLPPPTRRGARWGFVVVPVVVLGAAVGGAVVLTGDDGGGRDGPEQAVRDYLTAEANGDCEGSADLLSDRVVEEGGGRQALLDDCEDADDREVADDELAAIVDTIETTGVDHGRATVTYAGGAEPTQQVTIEVTLVDDGGAWKVDDLVPVTGELPEDSPLAAARDHAQAILDGDCEAFLAVLSTEALSTLGETPAAQASACEQQVGGGPSATDPDLGPVIQDSERDGTAVVGVTVMSESYEAGNNIFYVPVVEEDGEWRVDQVGWSDFPEDVGD
jgi:hypothetical protein